MHPLARIAIALLLLGTPTSALGTDADLRPEDVGGSGEVVVFACGGPPIDPEELRAAMREAGHALDVWLDEQVDDRALALDRARADALREEHYDWRLARETFCAEYARRAPEDDAYEECLLAYSADYEERLSPR